MVLELSYFYGLGALIVFLGAAAVGRISVRSVRDVEYVDRPVVAEQAQPAFSDADEVTEIQPTAGSTERHRWRDTFSRRRTPAH